VQVLPLLLRHHHMLLLLLLGQVQRAQGWLARGGRRQPLRS
jgi:hypothetical protein